MNLVKLIQLLIILLNFAPPLLKGAGGIAQESKVQIFSQNLDLSDITIGDKITYTLVVEHDKNTQLLPPKPLVMASEHFEAYGPEVKPLKSKGKQRGRILKSIEYKLVAYEPGAYNIPPMVIKCRDANGREFSVMSQPLGFSVRSLRSNDTQTIRDIKGPEGVPRNITPYILIWGIIIVGSSVAVYCYFRRRKSAIIKPEAVILQHLPHELALEELREIELMGLVTKGEVKEYCTRIADVIRRYLEKRYGIVAMELTTAKVLASLEIILARKDAIVVNEGGSHLCQREIDKIGDFLNACDSVKFAKYQPSADEAGNLLQQARKIVEVGR
ncbi:protein BatD [Candidatus Poribacteria bacterium]|nr:protein BatD [Candidatus Poribacteria bacterium]